MPTKKLLLKLEKKAELKKKINGFFYGIWFPFKMFFQRVKNNGWDDTDIWDLDVSLSEIILPRLKSFKEKTISYPDGLKSMEEWQGILDKMIFSFDALANDRENEIEISQELEDKLHENMMIRGENKMDKKSDKEWKIYAKKRMAMYRKMQEGFELFGKYFSNLID